MRLMGFDSSEKVTGDGAELGFPRGPNELPHFVVDVGLVEYCVIVCVQMIDSVTLRFFKQPGLFRDLIVSIQHSKYQQTINM